MSDFVAKLDAIEARADAAEDSNTWDEIDRDLAIVKAALFDARTEARRALERAEAGIDELGALARMNPFGDARRRARDDVAAAEQHIEAIGRQLARVERLRERRAGHDLAPFLQDLVLRAEKVQRHVAGDWPTKAAAVALAIYRDLDADAAIERATSILSSPLAEDPRVFLAAGLFDRPAKDAEIFLARCERSDLRLGAAYLTSGRALADAADLVRDLEIPADVLPAAIASGADRATIEARHFAFADRAPIVRSVVLLTDASIEATRGALLARQRLDDDVAAAALLSGRGVEDCEACGRRLHAAARGDADAEARIRRAAIASNRGPEACAALVVALQQRFTGSWASEAWILAAALAADDPPEPARRRAAVLL